MRPDPQAYADVLVVAIKSALAPVEARLERLALAEAAVVDLGKELVLLRERVVRVEERPLLPGPPGEKGADGKDGADGSPGLKYWGVYQDGKSYELGDIVTWAGSAWHCEEATTTKPGEYAGAKSWTLMVKRGRDGKDVAK